MRSVKCLVFLLLMCCFTFVFSQGTWELLHPKVTANQLVSLDFIDAEIGLAVGEVGTILKTTDGGDSWRIISTPWTANLTDVDFVTPDIAYIIGESGVILKSTDAGESWELQPIDFTNTLNRVRFYNADEGWIVGNTGLILRTTNGGETWKRIITSYKYNLTGLASVNRDTWVLVGFENTIMRTTDSGQTWAQPSLQAPGGNYYPPFDETCFTPMDIYFLDANVGWIAGKYQKSAITTQSILCKTTDGGANWDVVSIRESHFIGTNGGHSSRSPEGFATLRGGIQQIYFFDANTGICLTGPDPGYVQENNSNNLYYTKDGGVTWEGRMEVPQTTTPAPGRFCVLNSERVIATYPLGGFLHSTDQGVHWVTNDFIHRGLYFLIIGDNGILTAWGYQDNIWVADISVHLGAFSSYHSVDYGKTWATCSLPRTDGGGTVGSLDFVGVKYPDKETVWGIKAFGNSTAAIYETQDGGQTWSYQKDIAYNSSLQGRYATGDTLLQFGFIQKVDDDNNRFRIFTAMDSYDGGRTAETHQFPDLWNEITLFCPHSGCYYRNQISGYHFFNGQEGIVVGSDGNIVRTTDGGKSWRNIPSGVTDHLQDIYFINDKIGFIVGNFGRILKTEDGGLTWRKTSSGTQKNVYSIIFENEMNGWAGTRKGLSYTVDGGESWAPVTGQKINSMVGLLQYDASGNLYGYCWPELLCAQRQLIINGDEHLPPGIMCVKRADASQVADGVVMKPKRLQLYPNYPNPFNSTTMIQFELTEAGEIDLAIYNIQGKRVRQLESGYCTAGSHTVRWDGWDQQGHAVSSGVYVLRLNTEGHQQSQKMLYLR